MIAALPWRAKCTASGIHFLLSLAVFAAIVGVAITLWYPPPFFWIDGALHVIVFAAIIDVFAGPLLTFVVYRPGKRLLAMNLAVIAAVQCAALTWGVRAMYSQRPIVAAFVPHRENRFYPVTEAQLAQGGQPIEKVLALSSSRPPLVFVDLPEDPAQADQLLGSRLTSVLRQSERFRPIEGERLERLARTSRTTKTYEFTNPKFAEAIERFAARNGGDAKDVAFIPLYGRFGYALLAISRTDGSLKGVAAREINVR